MVRKTFNESKEQRKKLRNRESAQRARDRQKARMQWLENEVAVIKMRNEALMRENIFLKHFLLSRGLPVGKEFGIELKNLPSFVHHFDDVNNDSAMHRSESLAINLSRSGEVKQKQGCPINQDRNKAAGQDEHAVINASSSFIPPASR